MDFLLRNKRTIIGITLGAVAGYAYYHYVGCMTGACPITSQPLNSTLYGAVMGGLLLGRSTVAKQKPDQSPDDHGTR